MIVILRKLATLSVTVVALAGIAQAPAAFADDPVPGSRCDASAMYGIIRHGMSCMYGIWTDEGPQMTPGTGCGTPGDVAIATGSGKDTWWTTCRGGVWSPGYNPFTG